MSLAVRMLKLAYLLPLVHATLFLLGLAGSHGHGWRRLDLIGTLLGIADFPVSIIVIALAWVLPETIEIAAFGVLGTLWWFYVGRKTDEWMQRN
jgi:hypothetical protein